MNWEAIQAVAELTAAVGVLLSLVYLAMQVQRNTSSVKAATVTRASDLMNRHRTILWSDPENSEIYALAITGEPIEDEQLSLRARLFWAAIARDFEAVFYQHRSGHLPESIWQAWLKETRLLFATPGGRDAIQGLRKHYLSDEFADFLEEETEKLETVPVLELREAWEAARKERLRKASS